MDGHYLHHQQQQQAELHQFQLQQQFQQQLLPPHPHPPHLISSPPHPIAVHVDAGDRFPQWSLQETKELITFRAGLDRSFMETKRNKQLWEVIATHMKDKGHNRSAEQCKCKWKNLVTRYKGCETAEAESMRQQFPFFNDLAAIMADRERRLAWVEGEGISGSKKKLASAAGAAATTASSEEEDEENEDSEEAVENKVMITSAAARKKKKIMKMGSIESSAAGGMGMGMGSSNNMKEILEDFMRQQLQMDMQWREEFQARENERRMREYEWRQTMEALENERLMAEREWREREEQRRMREEARAEKRDAILTALLDRINRGDI